MKKGLFLPMVMLILTLTFSEQGCSRYGPVKLEYKYQEGDVLEYQTQISLSYQPKKQTLKIGGSEIQILTHVNEEGILTMAYLLSGIKMLEAQTDGQDDMAQLSQEVGCIIPFFGAADELLLERSDSYVRANPLLVYLQPIEMRRNGQVTASLLGIDELFPRHFFFLATLGEYAQSFFGLFSQPWIQFPDVPIKVGESWTQKGRSLTTFTLLGFEKVKGYLCAKIQSEQKIGKHQAQSTLFFAIEEGFLVKEEILLSYDIPIGEGREALTSELIRHKNLSGKELQQVREEMAKEVPQLHRRPPEDLSKATLTGLPAPDFSLPDLSGKQVKLTDFKGKVVLLNFWVTWMPNCIQMIPYFIELQKRYEEQPFSMVGIYLESEAERALGLVESVVRLNQVNYPMLMGNGDVYQAYCQIQQIPTTFLIDREGKFQRVYRGYQGKEVFEADIKALLAGQLLR